MTIPMLVSVTFFVLLLVHSLTFFSSCLAASPFNLSHPFPAYFIFDDSLVDVGNNNYILSIARVNYPPYGIDFPTGRPTGRFCNGKIVPDFVCDLISLPFPPPYLAPTSRGEAILQGVNYASGAAGIDRRSGFVFIGRVDFDQQIEWFANTVQQYEQLLGVEAAQERISQSFFSTTFGSNDYLDNFYLPVIPSRIIYTQQQFLQILINKLTAQVKRLYSLGVRILAVSNIGPVGCIPYQLAIYNKNGSCRPLIDNTVSVFNQATENVLGQLNSELPGAKFVYIDAYTPVMQFRTSPQNYGFRVADVACCGRGNFKGQVPCLPYSVPCPHRDDHLFWDPYHPSQAANKLLADNFYQTFSKQLFG